jgi:hypothetical protein
MKKQPRILPVGQDDSCCGIGMGCGEEYFLPKRTRASPFWEEALVAAFADQREAFGPTAGG